MKTELEIKDILNEVRELSKLQQGQDPQEGNRLLGIIDGLEFVLGDLAAWELL